MRKTLVAAICILSVALVLAVGAYFLYPAVADNFLGRQPGESEATPTPKTPDELLAQYMADVGGGDYEGMYALLSPTSKLGIAKEDFVTRNKNIYEGIEANNLTVTVSGTEKGEEGKVIVHYTTQMDTLAGTISFENSATFSRGEDKEYRLEWSPALIFPQMTGDDKVRVSTQTAKRGSIYDRNGEMLAGEGIASSVGFVPGKMRKSAEPSPYIAEPQATGEGVSPSPEGVTPTPDGTAAETPSPTPDEAAMAQASGDDSPTPEDDAAASSAQEPGSSPLPEQSREADIARIAELLEMTPESIEKKLSASYVKDDTFVALKTVAKSAYDLKEELLKVPGIKIVDTKVRYYPLAEKASHLIGYIQSISAEELGQLRGAGYHTNSVIGKSGLEKTYEDRLRAIDGREIAIVDPAGEKKQVLASTQKRDGEDIRLTIDAQLQGDLYDQFAADKSCSVAMNPLTGEVLALVSTPTFDGNEFVLGMSASRWKALNEDVNMPLYNRFKAALCPGSTFKGITAAIGLNTESISPEDDFGHSGLQWRKDSSWGGYYVTTTREYDGPANVKNALTYSDNIFFAKTALKIGAETFAEQLKAIGFEERIPFEYALYSSTISSTESFTSEIQLADSGFGQGQILVNPIHLAAIYASFVDDGSIPTPTLLYQDSPAATYWKANAFTPQTAQTVLSGLKEVVRRGTGEEARIGSVSLAGKTGTAEIKKSKDDATGTELGWFTLFTADKDAGDPLLVVSMVEDVKDRGGSHYVMPKVKAAFELRWGYKSRG